MKHETATAQTRDGQCPAHVFRADGPGPWPAVIVYMDGFGIRPALMQVGERIASDGYATLAPDLLHGRVPKQVLDGASVHYRCELYRGA